MEPADFGGEDVDRALAIETGHLQLATPLAVRFPPPAPISPLQTHFDKQIRPMLDVVDKLRGLGVTQEGIELPTIVVIGDQSHGKSSVLESLADITLPRGQGIATRVPLVLRLQSCKHFSEQSITIEYGNTKLNIPKEKLIEAAIDEATNVLAGTRKDVSDTPISLHVTKVNAPNLTMVDLPGITRVPVHGQPQNIYEQIAGMIHKYITPKESIILNVISATVDFPTCESIRMSQSADKEGRRTLAVITKVDRAPEGLYEKVTGGSVNVGLGYICVRNRTENEKSNEEARSVEEALFDSHPSLCKLDKSTVGIPMLAYRLTCIQAKMVQGCLPGLHQRLYDALSKRRLDLEGLPKHAASKSEAAILYAKIQNDRNKALNLLLREGRLDDFLDDSKMHYTARLHEMFKEFSAQLTSSGRDFLNSDNVEDISKLITEHQGTCLPNFLPHNVLHSLVKKEIDRISSFCFKLVSEAYAYAGQIAETVNNLFCEGFQQLEACFRFETTEKLRISEKESRDFVKRMLEKVTTVVLTVNDDYVANLDKINDSVENAKTSNNYDTSVIFQENAILKLNELENASPAYKEAWRLKGSVAAYWNIVQKRLADEISLEIYFALQTTILQGVNDQLTVKIWSGELNLMNLMQQDLTIVQKRIGLEHSIDTLQSSVTLLSKLKFT